jgi:type II secretory pathway component PulL
VSKTVFLDFKGRELSVYSFDNGGRNGQPAGSFTIPVEENYSFAFDKPAGAEESILSLPLSLLDFRILELPFSDVKKVKELVPFEIDNLVLGGSDSVVFDAFILGSGDGKSQVLVAYIGKKILRTILNKLKASGIDPKAVVSLELAYAVSSSASAEEIAGKLLSPEPLEEKDRISAAVAEIKNPTVNLRRGEFAYTADTERTKKSLMMTAALVVLVLFIFLADNVMVIVSTKRENDSIKESIRKTYQGLFPSERKISNELYQLKAHMKELKDKESSFVGVSPLDTLLDLSGASRPGVSFIEITVDRDLIILKGEAPTMSDVQKTKTDLEKVFTEITISDTKPSVQGKTLFTLTVRGRKA